MEVIATSLHCYSSSESPSSSTLNHHLHFPISPMNICCDFTSILGQFFYRFSVIDIFLWERAIFCPFLITFIWVNRGFNQKFQPLEITIHSFLIPRSLLRYQFNFHRYLEIPFINLTKPEPYLKKKYPTNPCYLLVCQH